MAQRHCGGYAILFCRFRDGEKESRGNTVEQRKIARVDKLKHDVENLTVLREICGVRRRGREVFSEGSVGYGAEIGVVDVEEHFVAGAEYDDVAPDASRSVSCLSHLNGIRGCHLGTLTWSAVPTLRLYVLHLHTDTTNMGQKLKVFERSRD